MDTRERAFLDRLEQLQKAAGLSDTELARRMGVSYTMLWRAKNDDSRSFGLKFADGARSVFPELRGFLLGDSPIITVDALTGTDEGGA